MGRIEKSIEIKAPPERVWEMLALDRLTEWNEGFQKSSVARAMKCRGILGKMLFKLASVGGDKEIGRDLERFKNIVEK